MIITIKKAQKMLASKRAILRRYQEDGTELASLDHLPRTDYETVTASSEWDHDAGTGHWVLDGDRGETLHVPIEPASPAVAMGRIRSPAKTAAARRNLDGHRPIPPTLPRCQQCAGKVRRCAACVASGPSRTPYP